MGIVVVLVFYAFVGAVVAGLIRTRSKEKQDGVPPQPYRPGQPPPPLDAKEKKYMKVGAVGGLLFVGGMYLVGKQMNGDKQTSGSYQSGSPNYQSTPAYNSQAAEVWVNGYMRHDGTYVPGHWRSAADGDPYNNWSTQGNYNPHTGRTGYRRP